MAAGDQPGSGVLRLVDDSVIDSPVGCPKVSFSSMYRHVGTLVDGGMLEVVAEQRVHSVLERRYRLREEPTEVDPLTLWLDSDELTTLVEELHKPIQKRLRSKPKAGRTPYLLSPILFPTEPY